MASTNEALRWGGMGFNFREAQITGHDVACGNVKVDGNNNVVHNYHNSPESADKVKNVLSWLKPHAVDYLPAHEEAHSRQTPGTGGWFFNTRAYTIWRGLGSSEPALPNLECVGIPGAGKTTLASAVVENLQPENSTSHPGDDDDPRIVLYVYFRHDTQSHQTIPNVLASLLHQVVRIKRYISDELHKLCEAFSSSRIIPAPDRMIKILRLELSAYHKVFIVVDALDEYSTETYSLTHDLVSHLERLNARLLITSRHHVDFAPHTFSSLHIAAHAEDIQRLVLNHVKGNLAKIIARTPLLLEEIVTTIVRKAEGMFVIARLLIESIPDLLTSTDIRTALKMLPTGLHDTYWMTMNRILKQKPHIAELGKKTLYWTFLAKRRLRLSVLELQHAVSFRSGEATWSGEDLISEEMILSSCLGLVVFVKNEKGVLECQFSHFTTKEFLETCWQVYFPDGERQITETCLSYLTVAVSAIPPELTERIIHTESWSARDHDDQWHHYRTSEFALSVYAATFWGAHAKAFDGMIPLDAYASFFKHPISPCMVNSDKDGTYIISTIPMRPDHYWTLYFTRFGLVECLQWHAAAIQNHDNAAEVPFNYNDVRDGVGWTALHLAALYGHLDVVIFLLDSGADVNQHDKVNDSPLHLAVEAGNTGVAIVQLLLGRGALVDEPGWEQRAPISYAISPLLTSNQPSPDIICLLLQHEVDIYREAKHGSTPLSLAQQSGNPEIEELLEEYARTHPPKRRAYDQIFPGGHRSAVDNVSEIMLGLYSDWSMFDAAPSFSPEREIFPTVDEPGTYNPSRSSRTLYSSFHGGRQLLINSSSSSSSSMTRDPQSQPSRSVERPTQSSSPSITTQRFAPDLCSSLPKCLSGPLVMDTSSVVRRVCEDGNNSLFPTMARGDGSAGFTLPRIEELYRSSSDPAEPAASSRRLALAVQIPALQPTGSTTAQQIPKQATKRARATQTPSPVTSHGKRMKFS